MEDFIGKKISEIDELGNGVTVIYFTDGTFLVCSGPVTASTDLVIPAAGEPEVDDEDSDDEDDEEPAPKKGKGKKPAAKKEEPDYEWDDLVDMDWEDLVEVADEEGVEYDEFEEDEDEAGLRKAIAKELGIAIPKKGKK